MTYENDNFTGVRTIRVTRPITSDLLYPPDFFLKKIAKAVKKVGDKIGDTKVATAIRTTKAYQNVAKPILKVAVPVAAAVGLGALAAPLVKSGITAIKAKQAANAVTKAAAGAAKVPGIVPKVDVVSSVTGSQGTPVLKAVGGTLKDRVLNVAEKINPQLKKGLLQKGKSLLDKGKAKLTEGQLQYEQDRTTPATLPKTREVKEAEELLLSPTEETSGGTTLQAGGFSISPMIILGVLGMIVLLGFVAKK